jgi:DNA-binding response OmpR family regulator
MRNNQSRLRVLVADRDPDAADSLRILVSLWGHDVRTAASADEALTVARAHRPHVALLDPGFGLARLLRSDRATAGTVLVATEPAGGYDHDLNRPFDLGTLERLFCGRSVARC